MEHERNYEEEINIVGKQVADALRGYGYSDFAQQYEQALQRSVLSPKEVLVHSRIANTTLRELNTLQAERYANHPALEKNVQIQERLDTAIQKQQELGVQKSQRIEDLSFPAKMYLEENSKPLEHAAQQVKNYLEEKQAYHPESKKQFGKFSLHDSLDIQLQSYRSLPTSYNMDNLERYTKAGIQVMREDYESAKAALQKENEDYVRERLYLSPEGKRMILQKAELGEFRMPNQEKGHTVASRIDYAQEQLDQYARTKEQIFAIDQERSEGPSWKQALSSPAVEKWESKSADVSTNRTDTWRTTLQKDYSHLSTEQQERYAGLQRNIVPASPSKDQEMEM